MIKRDELEQIIAQNPQVDGHLLLRAIQEAESVDANKLPMVNFNLKLPYSSDGYGFTSRIHWD